MQDWTKVSNCPMCGSRPAWHETEKGVEIHCTNEECAMPSIEIERPKTLDDAVDSWEMIASVRKAEECNQEGD